MADKKNRPWFAPGLAQRALPGLLILLLAAGLAGCAGNAPLRDAPSGSRSQLGYAALTGDAYGGEVKLSAFAPPADAQPPSQVFEGTLQLSGQPSTRTIHADAAYLSAQQVKQARSLPTGFDYDFVQTGNILLPVQRGYIVTDHPHWDFILQPGRVWDEPGDHGYTRAALPFALVQKHMNCTHYGVLSFLFKSDGTISKAAMQISSETCKYLQFDMWALLDARYRPHPVQGKQAVIAAYEENQSHRLPQRPVARLAQDHPGVDPSRLAIGKRSARTLYGLVVDGINYVSPCPTRHGNYPYCAELAFPSYSTAKSAEGALAYLAIAQRHPDVGSLSVAAFAPVPSCGVESWQDVSLRNLIDMTSGHYDSDRYMADEDNVKTAGFFYAPSAAARARFACTAYTRKAAPGTTWTYHTSATFLLGMELTGYLRSLPGKQDADIFRDVVDARVYAPLHLSATARVTRRTQGSASQPFFGYGLQFTSDDVARLAVFVGKHDGKLDNRQVLDPQLLAAALQRVPGQRGSVVSGYPDFRYQLGFWARNVASQAGCKKPVWVPFMSGFGGISVVLYPNGIVYYNVGDAGTAQAFDWSPSARVVNRIDNFCGS